MDIEQYSIETSFGWVKGYPLNQTDPVNHPGAGFHNGIDYGVPMQTPVIVNGVQIALSNNTGSTTGPHLHVGKYVGGAAQDPGVGNGFNFDSAVVYDVGKDAVNGSFVRITADGALWNYLHLEDGSITVKAGQKLEGDNEMAEIFNSGDAQNVTNQLLGGGTPPEWISKYANGETSYKDARQKIDGEVELQKLLFVNDGDLDNQANMTGWPRDAGLLGWGWKRLAENYFWPKLQMEHSEKKPAATDPPATTTNFTDADRQTAAETNSILKQIWSKISSVFK